MGSTWKPAGRREACWTFVREKGLQNYSGHSTNFLPVICVLARNVETPYACTLDHGDYSITPLMYSKTEGINVWFFRFYPGVRFLSLSSLSRKNIDRLRSYNYQTSTLAHTRARQLCGRSISGSVRWGWVRLSGPQMGTEAMKTIWLNIVRIMIITSDNNKYHHNMVIIMILNILPIIIIIDNHNYDTTNTATTNDNKSGLVGPFRQMLQVLYFLGSWSLGMLSSTKSTRQVSDCWSL